MSTEQSEHLSAKRVIFSFMPLTATQYDIATHNYGFSIVSYFKTQFLETFTKVVNDIYV
jgi:hypothetical protein